MIAEIAVLASIGLWLLKPNGVQGFVLEFIEGHEEVVPKVQTFCHKNLEVKVCRDPSRQLFVLCDREDEKAARLRDLWRIFPALRDTWCEIGNVGPPPPC